MKSTSLIGVVLIIAGVLILVFGGFSFTHQEQVVKAGPLEINANKRESVPISPIAGYLCVGGGIVLLLAGGRKAS